MPQTSDRISSLAGRWAKISSEQITTMAPWERDCFAADVRSMAASLLRQDEHKGLRGLIRKVIGK